MLADYLPILMLLGLAVLFATASVFVAERMGPSKPNPAKLAPYECGIVPEQVPAERFPVKFYLIAMLFIIFDVEVVFFYPWAVTLRELGPYGLGVMGLFAGLVGLAYVYEWRMGGLEWEEMPSIRRLLSQRMVERARVPERAGL